MDSNIWKYQIWTKETSYPKGTTWTLFLLSTFFFIILFVSFGLKYPIYQDYYGIVEETGNPILKVPILIKELAIFEQAIINEPDMKLVQIDSNIQIENNQSYVFVYIESNISDECLIKNNIVTIRLKIKDVTFLEEHYESLVKGMKNERIK